MTQVQVRTGTEGPRHDPYHFTETTVRRLGRVFEAHWGLAEWYRIDGQEVDAAAWIAAAGAAPGEFEAWQHAARERRVTRHLRSCGGRFECREVDGYPGECFLICGCGEHLDYSFDRSAVE